MDVEAYLRRIEYHGPRQPSATTLRQLHRQHLFTAPFENLDIPLGTKIGLDLGSIYEKIAVRRRGGFCYELNGLFGQLLTALGFSVQMLSARVRREDGGFGPEFDHMLLKVDWRSRGWSTSVSAIPSSIPSPSSQAAPIESKVIVMWCCRFAMSGNCSAKMQEGQFRSMPSAMFRMN